MCIVVLLISKFLYIAYAKPLISASSVASVMMFGFIQGQMGEVERTIHTKLKDQLTVS